MKKFIFIFLIFSFSNSCVHAQKENIQHIKAKLTQASIYLQGATLTHTASANLKSGAQEIIIEELSPEIEINSLKVNISGNNIISSVEFSNDYLNNKKENAVVQKLRDSLKIYEKQLREISNAISIDKKLLKTLSDGISNNTQQKEKVLSPAEISANMELYKTKAPALQINIDNNQEKQSYINQHITRLKQQIKQDESAERLRSGVLIVNVSSYLAGKANFTITYYTEKASWTPCYDIQVQSIEKKVSFTAKAEVQQTTGLDWEQVKLNLSNARPNQSNTAPVFNTWFLHYRTYVTRAAYANQLAAQPKTMAKVSLSQDETDLNNETSNSLDNFIDLQENEVEASYNISLPYNICGNGKSQLIELKKYEIEAKYYYYAAPKLSDETYLMASLTNWEQYHLLPGIANISYNGTFIGKTQFRAETTDSNLLLTLSTEPRISVKREKRTNFSSSKTLGNNITETRAYAITVRNNTTKPISFNLKDQYPISTDKDMEIRLIEVTPQANNSRKETGIISWNFELSEGESKTFLITYSVKHAKDREIDLD